VQRLRELGWVEGRTVAIEYRWGEARSDRWAEITAEFVRLKVDVIATYNTPTTVTAKKVTSAVPIIFALAADPVGSGLVASLARPGGNVTGMSTQHADFPGKRLALLRDVVPGLRRLAVMANVGNSASVREMEEVQQMTQTLGLDFVASEVRRAEDITPALEALKGRVDALYLPPDALTDANRVLINGAALSARLPTMYPTGNMSKREVSCHMGQTTPIFFGARPIWSTRFCAGRSQVKFQSSSRPSSISLSISRPRRRSVSKFLTGCSRSPTR
jgi:putative ABC transport system substrate-binding protein